MKIDITDAQQLGALDKQGKELGAAFQKTADEFTTLFRSACEKHALDPMKVGIDFETGEVSEVAPPAPRIGLIADWRGN